MCQYVNGGDTAVMKYLNRKSSLLLFYIVNECHCLISLSDKTYQHNSCAARVAQHHFRKNSTVAVLSTNFYKRQPAFSELRRPVVQEDSLMKLVSLITRFCLVSMQAAKNDSFCSLRLYD